jgi:hypothetical protein
LPIIFSKDLINWKQVWNSNCYKELYYETNTYLIYKIYVLGRICIF